MLAEWITGKDQYPANFVGYPGFRIRVLEKHGILSYLDDGSLDNGRRRAKALENPCQRQSYDLALPGWTEADVESSAYAISDYSVTPSLGGETALHQFREKLHRYGLKLMLDFVPNHLGLDHPWVNSRPELFIQSKQSAAGNFFSEGNGAGHWLAHGKDPYFAPWIDTAQLDYSRTETHRAMVDLLKSVAAKCDAVRCDMSMLSSGRIFSKTWQHLIGASWEAPTEFWHTAIQTVKALHPEFLFLAEAYWGWSPTCRLSDSHLYLRETIL